MKLLTAEEMIERDIIAQQGLANCCMDAQSQQRGLEQYTQSAEEIAMNRQALYEYARYIGIKKKDSAIYTIKNSAYF